jgi:hypothetical protein
MIRNPVLTAAKKSRRGKSIISTQRFYARNAVLRSVLPGFVRPIGNTSVQLRKNI